MTGLFDWFFQPIAGGEGMNNLGLIGATLKDVGSQLNGDDARALDRFQARAHRQPLDKPVGQPVVSSRPLQAFDIQPPEDLHERIRRLVQSY